jgi:hypothetical protein
MSLFGFPSLSSFITIDLRMSVSGVLERLSVVPPNPFVDVLKEVTLFFISNRIKKDENRGERMCHSKTMVNREANEEVK